MHNRGMLGGRGDIGHIAIVASGVYVTDAKAVRGKVEIRYRWVKPPLLFIAGRVGSEVKQAGRARRATSSQPSPDHAPP